MGKLTSDVFNESCCDGGVGNEHESARPCGCDPGCKTTQWPAGRPCERHQAEGIVGFQSVTVPAVVSYPAMSCYIDNIGIKEEGPLASREAAGLSSGGDKVLTSGQCSVAGNGPQQGFTTGATRSTDAGKVDFEGHINPDVLAVFGEYMNAHRVQRDGRVRASDNWQQGIPIYRYVKSLVRHTFEFWRMWRGSVVVNSDNGSYFTFREVTSAIMFNVMGIVFEAVQRHPQFLDAHQIPTWQREQWERAGQEKDPTAKPQTAAEMAQTRAECLKTMTNAQLQPPMGEESGPVGSFYFTCPQDGEKNCCPGDENTHRRCIRIAARCRARADSRMR